jgi:hypothetical protein
LPYFKARSDRQLAVRNKECFDGLSMNGIQPCSSNS